MELRLGRPPDGAGRLPKELAVYDFLDALGVRYWQLDRLPNETPDQRRAAEAKLDAMICKNIFLSDRRQARFYLLMLPHDRKFVTGDVTQRLGVSHLSFGTPQHMAALLDLTPGSVSVMGLRNDREGRVLLVMDRAVFDSDFFACHPCVNTASVRFSTSDLRDRVLPALGHPPVLVDLPYIPDSRI